MEKLLAYLEAVYPLPPDLRARLTASFHRRELPRLGVLLKAGHVCRELTYIETGILRCFYSHHTIEISHSFPREGDFVMDVNSFITQTPGSEIIQAMSKAVVWAISHTDLDRIYTDFPIFNYHGRAIMQRYFAQAESRLKYMRLLKTADRIQTLLSTDPDLLQRVPAKYLASYIGTTEVNLYKLKNKR